VQASWGAQVTPPLSRLRQQTLPAAQAEPSRQAMLAPPAHVAWASMHMVPLGWTQHVWVPGLQDI